MVLLFSPRERVLKDYKNYFKLNSAINKENVQSLQAQISSFTSVLRYVALVMDEMKVQFSGQLIGFIDLGDQMTNFATLTNKDLIATHAFAFLVRGYDLI